MEQLNRKLLIVEDDPGLLNQLKWCFEDYDVFTAEDRESAIAELRRHEPMVVLQDLGLPQRRVVLGYWLFCALLGALALVVSSRLFKGLAIVVLAGSVMVALALLSRRVEARAGDRPEQ